jgi:hypothetical protein
MLLGWIAGTMMQTDPGLVAYLPQDKVWGYAMAWPVLCWCWLWAKSSWLDAQSRTAQPKPDLLL